MEIVFHRYGSICEPDIMEAFQSLGLTVIEEDAEIYQKSIEPEKRISMLAEAILTHQTSFVFSINYFPYISQVCERLHVLYLCLSVDCPVLELFQKRSAMAAIVFFCLTMNNMNRSEEKMRTIFFICRWVPTLPAGIR